MVFYDSNRKESRTGGKPGGHQMPELWKSLHSQVTCRKNWIMGNGRSEENQGNSEGCLLSQLQRRKTKSQHTEQQQLMKGHCQFPSFKD